MALARLKTDFLPNPSKYPLSEALYSDPSWYYAPSPYYNESHVRVRSTFTSLTLRDAMRRWVDNNLPEPLLAEWDHPTESKIPADLPRKAADARFLQRFFAPDFEFVGGVKNKDWDTFHTLIVIDELARTGSSGGLSIGLPPVIMHGNAKLHEEVVVPCLRGEKRICLAITEPGAGSDVAGIQATAVKTPDGKHYVVNGIKKWITNGVYADFFTTAVQTPNGVSVLLIPRTKGVTTKPMQCMGAWGSGTTFIEFDNVLVPVENLIGEEGMGLLVIFLNFNAERWGSIAIANRMARCCVEEAALFAKRRKTFGQQLVKNAAIMQKLGHMTRLVEATHAWLEQITFELERTPEDQGQNVGGSLALLKAQASTTMEFCAREACQILGGISYTHGGSGGKVERIYREVRAFAIPAGSEEIMLMLGVRDGLKRSSKNHKKYLDSQKARL